MIFERTMICSYPMFYLLQDGYKRLQVVVVGVLSAQKPSEVSSSRNPELEDEWPPGSCFQTGFSTDKEGNAINQT